MNICKLFKIEKFLFDDMTYWKKIKNHHFYFPQDCKNPEELSKFILDPIKPGVKIFKTRKRRRVFVEYTAEGSGILCKKNFLFRHKKDCFRVHDFAYREILNHRKFSQCPYPIPKILGYYEKRFLGFPVECGMFMSFFEGFDQVQASDHERVQQLIYDLYKTGYFHGDLNTKNILINKNSGKIALCDLDYVEIVKPETLRYLLLMAGNFLYAAEYRYPENVDEDYKQQFIFSLYKKLPEDSVCDFDVFKQTILKISTYPLGKPTPEIVFENTDF